MRVLVWSFKGGVGKSTISAILAKNSGFPVVTNDAYSILEGVVQDLTILGHDDIIPQKYNNIIIDLGGYVEERVVSAIRQSDLVILPMTAETATVKSALSAVAEIQAFGKPILLVANRATEQDALDIQEVFGENQPIVRLKESRYFQRIFESGPETGLEEIADYALLRYAYREPISQAQTLIQQVYGYK